MLPQIGNAIGNWAQPFIFDCIVKKQVNFQTEEKKTRLEFRGVIAPLSPRRLQIKSEGQRSWRWLEVHATTDLELKIDNEVLFKGVKYRILAVEDWSDYGYFRYELAEGFTS